MEKTVAKNESSSSMISLRMTKSMVNDLKKLAADESMGYQTLIKNILDKEIKKRKNN